MQATIVKHTCGGPSFGRLTAGCPRCEELKNGAKPREMRGSRNRRMENERVLAILKHDCKKSGCAIVCTFGDW